MARFKWFKYVWVGAITLFLMATLTLRPAQLNPLQPIPSIR